MRRVRLLDSYRIFDASGRLAWVHVDKEFGFRKAAEICGRLEQCTENMDYIPVKDFGVKEEKTRL